MPFFSRLNHPCVLFSALALRSTVKYGAYCLLLFSSFLIFHYHSSFSGLHTSSTTYPSCLWASSQHPIKLFTYTNPPCHLRAQSGFRQKFPSPFGESKKVSCPSVSFPSHFCTWTTISFYCSTGVPFYPCTGNRFCLPRFQAVPCLVFIPPSSHH